VLPAAPVVQRIKSGQTLRVAGLGAPLDTNGKTPILDAFNTALINEMARRWGIPVQAIPNSFGAAAEDVLASGQADLAIGLEPHWGAVDRVDFTGIYAQHGYRLMVPFGSTAVQQFGDLFSGRRQIGYFTDDPAAIELAKEIATKVRIAEIRPIPLRTDQDAIQVLVTDRVANAVFGDTLRLNSIVQAYPKFVQIVGDTYGQKPLSFAVPRNDADFRALVDATLQDMYRDGTYQRLWKDNFGIGDPLQFVMQPGPSMLFGIKTSG
jgi:polar amino acid transport system substrate-binding protein